MFTEVKNRCVEGVVGSDGLSVSGKLTTAANGRPAAHHTFGPQQLPLRWPPAPSTRSKPGLNGPIPTVSKDPLCGASRQRDRRYPAVVALAVISLSFHPIGWLITVRYRIPSRVRLLPWRIDSAGSLAALIPSDMVAKAIMERTGNCGLRFDDMTKTSVWSGFSPFHTEVLRVLPKRFGVGTRCPRSKAAAANGQGRGVPDPATSRHR
jgi:hypothetical protein